MTKKITLCDKSIIELDLSTPELINHFNSPNNYTEAILNQFNNADYYKQFVSEKDKVILDLGANVGLFAIYAHPFAERILCVEPTPSHYNLLCQLTKDFEKIETFQCAVSPINGFIAFYTNESSTTMNSLINRGGSPIMVKGMTIPEIMKERDISHVDFIKMDIEGSEDLVLNEKCLGFIYKNVPKILIEFHNNVVHEVEKHQKLFAQNGYRVDRFNWDAIICEKI
jgi:FkbM family methyltransferase